VPNKKRIEITARIFIDDLNLALKRKAGKTIHIGEPNETTEEVILLKNYLSQHLKIKTNGAVTPILFVNKELEGNIVICYLKAENVAKIKTLEIENNNLMELNSEQQNVIQTTINGKKQSLLLTNENPKGRIEL
jgi:hypothetical protein